MADQEKSELETLSNEVLKNARILTDAEILEMHLR